MRICTMRVRPETVNCCSCAESYTKPKSFAGRKNEYETDFFQKKSGRIRNLYVSMFMISCAVCGIAGRTLSVTT